MARSQLEARGCIGEAAPYHRRLTVSVFSPRDEEDTLRARIFREQRPDNWPTRSLQAPVMEADIVLLNCKTRGFAAPRIDGKNASTPIRAGVRRRSSLARVGRRRRLQR
jgi:hypothetical protein